MPLIFFQNCSGQPLSCWGTQTCAEKARSKETFTALRLSCKKWLFGAHHTARQTSQRKVGHDFCSVLRLYTEHSQKSAQVPWVKCCCESDVSISWPFSVKKNQKDIFNKTSIMNIKMYTSDLSLGLWLISPVSGVGALGHRPRCFRAGQLCCSFFPPIIPFMSVVRGVRFLSWTPC